MKESLKQLYARVRFLTGLNQQQIADKLKVKRTYLSTEINSGEERASIRTKIELTFAKELAGSFQKEDTNPHETIIKLLKFIAKKQGATDKEINKIMSLKN